MTETATQYNNSASVTHVATGAYITTGTAAAIAITLGFRPMYVKVVNVTSSDVCSMEWIYPMTDAYGIKLYDAGTSEAGYTYITSLGITDAADGFVIGLDTDLNVTSEQLYWVAIG